MLSPRSAIRTFEHEGETFTLVFDMETIARFEDATDLSIFETMRGMAGGVMPKLSVMGSLLQAALSANHPEVTRAEAMAMMVDPEIQAIFAESMAAGMPQPADATEGGDAAPGNRQTRRATKSRSAGKTG